MNQLRFSFQGSKEEDITMGSLEPESDEFIESLSNKDGSKVYILKPSFFSAERKVNDCMRYILKKDGEELKLRKLENDSEISTKSNPRIVI